MFLRAVDNPLYPTPEVAFTNAGLCAYNNGDMITAETQFRKALQRNPTVVPALLHMSSIAYENEKYLSARGYLQRYLAVAKHNAQSLWLGIRIERELGDRDALSSYELLLRANYPDSNEVMLLDE
jgi:type IV pilus assembly protein PilF